MEIIDIDELVARNPRVDEDTLRKFAKSKREKKPAAGAVPAPYGRRLRQAGDNAWRKGAKFTRTK